MNRTSKTEEVPEGNGEGRSGGKAAHPQPGHNKNVLRGAAVIVCVLFLLAVVIIWSLNGWNRKGEPVSVPQEAMLAGTAGEGAYFLLSSIENAAEQIGKEYGCAVLLKGGHDLNDANDYLFQNGRGRWFCGQRIHNPNTHGTGCTLSSAIASNLAKGFPLEEAVERAKEYISGALGAMLDLGRGSGPMDHGFDVKSRFFSGPEGTA